MESSIRAYTKEDNEAVTEMFKEENVPSELMVHDKYDSFVFDDGEVVGVMTIKEEHGYPVVLHVCVRKDRRTFKMVRMWVNFFRYYAKSKGFKKGIVQVRKDDNGRTRKVLEYFSGCKESYKKGQYSDWYLVNI